MPVQSSAQTRKSTQPKTVEPKKRKRVLPSHRTFRLSRKTNLKPKPLPGFKTLVKEPFSLLKSNKRVFFWLIVIYAALLFVFSKGLGSSFDIVQTKDEFESYLGEDNQNLQTSYTLFNYLVSSFNSQLGDVSGTYQLFISILIVLGTIWLCRQLFAGEKAEIRDIFYKGMYPIVPFILILVVISLQLIPAVVGNFIFSTVLENGLAISFLEKFIWFLLFAVSLLISLYMVLSSVFALNIVTLPDVRPMQALRSARDLVLHRRIGIFARLLILPLIGFVLSAVIFVPLIMLVPVIVEPLFLVASCFALVFMTVYMYNFYRLLL